MGGEKITTMVLKVDLQCCSCYKKVKKILCKFPQIRDQAYDEKVNTVTITVVCCNPEKLRDKLCSKGCGVITCIEIKEPPKHKPHKNTETESCDKEVPQRTPVTPPPPPPPPEPVTVMLVSIQENPSPPTGYCCGQCYEGHTGGPCNQRCRRRAPPPPCCDNYGPWRYGYVRCCCVSRCAQYFYY